MRNRLQQLGDEYDLLVVGGGINGAGAARDAALRGLRVVLVEKNDFGSGTSSKTSKLAHGGLRYLEQGTFRLVWQACQERRRLLQQAPHLVRPLPFVFPVYRGMRLGLFRLRLGMLLYDLLAAFRNVRRHRMLSKRNTNSWREGLRSRDLLGAALYYDAAMDDARLVLANVLAARDAGAVVLNDVEALRLERHPDGPTIVHVRDTGTDARAAIRTRGVLACTGPWTNAFLSPLPGAVRPLAVTRGTHVVVRRLVERAFTLMTQDGERVFFVLPWLGLSLIGTTDVDDTGDPDRVAPTTAEIDELLTETNRHFPEAKLTRGDVLAAFAGLRPLLHMQGRAAKRSREHAVLEPVPGVWVVAGGKYTTYRAVAEEVVDRIQKRLGRHGKCRTTQEPLPGGDLRWSASEHWDEGPLFLQAVAELEKSVREKEPTSRFHDGTIRHLVRTRGSRAWPLAQLLGEGAHLGTRLCEHHPFVGAEVVYAVREELALHLEDWYLRRSPMAYSACSGLDSLELVSDLFAAELGWSDHEKQSERARCRQKLLELRVDTRP